jgi:hypothetical protein
MANVINATSTGNGGLVSTGDDSGILNIQTNETTAITVDTSQNVGIGTSSPTTKLHITGNLTIENSSNAPFINFVESGDNTDVKARIEMDQVSGTAGNLLFYTEGSGTLAERMRITSDGNLFVGLTSSGIGGTTGGIQNSQSIANNSIFTRNTSATPYGLLINYSAAAPNNTGSPFIECYDTGATRFVARSNGGLANYQANNANLSDQLEKKNIELAPNYLDKICQIPVKTFLFNDQTDTDLNLGAIAQDVQAVCPELVMESNWAGKGEPEKMRLSIYQTDLQYALMKSIQELKQINDTQAETINALTARIVALETA